MSQSNDNIYAREQNVGPFRFDEKVAAVFPDMITRSVPGYEDIIKGIQQLATDFITQDSNCYDLGCSLGAATLALSYGNHETGVEIIGVDNSDAMISRCHSNIEGFKHQTPIKLINDTIQATRIENASMVVLNYTLQFVPQPERRIVLENIYKGLNSGGLLILSEKVVFEDPTINQLMIKLHHQFKRDNGYSELEISQKRNALENVLIPETIKEHIERLESIGFAPVNCWNQNLNFVSFLAIKP
jgi:tRNA (cmo5U34)-methyltransferase